MSLSSPLDSPDNTLLVARHPIQVVANRTGLSMHVLRAWERRYGAIKPQRAEGNRRLYSDEDVERLSLLKRATTAGRRIGDVAQLSLQSLVELVGTDEQPAEFPTTPLKGSNLTDTARHVGTVLVSIETLDSDALESAIAKAATEFGMPILLEQVLAPLLREIGDRFRDGNLRIAHEHMATAIIRTFLGSRLALANSDRTGPRILVATPARQSHELGALMVAVTAASGGYRVLYLGANVPADDLIFAARNAGVQAIALSLTCAPLSLDIADDLRRVRQGVDPKVLLFLGGTGATAYRSGLGDMQRTVWVDSLSEFRDDLDRALSQGQE